MGIAKGGGACYNLSTQEGVFFMGNKKNKVILTCTECLSRNYTTSKNQSQKGERLELMKFCKKCGKHTLHKETK